MKEGTFMWEGLDNLGFKLELFVQRLGRPLDGAKLIGCEWVEGPEDKGTVLIKHWELALGHLITAPVQTVTVWFPNMANPITQRSDLSHANTTSVPLPILDTDVKNVFRYTLCQEFRAPFSKVALFLLSKSRGNPQNVAMENQQELWEQTPQWPMYCWTTSTLLVHDQINSLSKMAEWNNTIP